MAATSLIGSSHSHGSVSIGAAFVEEGRIAYTSLDEGGTRSIWTVAPDGTDPRVVVSTGQPYEAIWSPDGHRFAYRSGSDLFVADADGSNVTRLTSKRTYGPGFVVGTQKAASWSPDGTRVLFAYAADSGGAAIVVASVDGSWARRLTGTKAVNVTPRWSPDGQRIVYLRYTASRRQIATMLPNGSDKVRLAHGNSLGPIAWGPAWSPDGLRIAFTRYNTSTELNDLFVMDRDGTDKQLLATGLVRSWGPVKWSPDGSRIAFLRLGEGRYQIFTIAPDGTEDRQITSDASDHIDFVWSPTGEHLAYGNADTGQIYVTSVDGTSTRAVTSDSSRRHGLPDWQPATEP